MNKKIFIGLSLVLLLGTVMTPAMARHAGRKSVKGVSEENKGLQPLDYTPVYYHTDLVQGTEVVDDDWWSGYSDKGKLYDTSDLRKSPNGQTVHDVLAFYQGRFLKRDYTKPYVLVREADGLYKSRGELVNYQFNEEYGGAKRRAVVTTWLKLDEDGQFEWMVYRADYYTRGEGKMEYINSRVYTVWDDDLGANWNIEGDWVVEASGNLHDMTVTDQTGDSFEGYGTYQDGPQTWTIKNGEVDGNSIEMDWIYENGNYEAYFTGTIDSDGTMSGTFDDTSGHEDLSWHTVEGGAKGPLVPDGIYGSLESAIEAGPANVGGQRPGKQQGGETELAWEGGEVVKGEQPEPQEGEREIFESGGWMKIMSEDGDEPGLNAVVAGGDRSID